MTVLLGYTNQHPAKLHGVVAVVRNQAEQTTALPLHFSNACPGSSGQARTSDTVLETSGGRRTPSSNELGELLESCDPTERRGTPLNRQLSLSASIKNDISLIRLCQIKFAYSEF